MGTRVDEMNGRYWRFKKINMFPNKTLVPRVAIHINVDFGEANLVS